MVVVLILALVVFLEHRAIAARVAVGVLMAGAGACLLLTYARTAWIALAVALIALALMRYRRFLAIGVVGLLLAVVGLPTLVDKVQARFGDVTSREQAQSGNSWSWRTGNWSAILPYGYARPLTGQGFGSYPRLTVEHFGTENRDYPTIADKQHPATSARGLLAHNDYVRTFVELGVPGVVLWVAVLLGLLTGCARALRRPAVGAMAAAGVAVALSLIVIATSDNLLSAPVMLYGFALCGAVIGADARLRRAAPARAQVAPQRPEAAAPIVEPSREEPREAVAAEEERLAAPVPPRQPPRASMDRARARLRGLFGRRR
jgi:O-antigen ligase